MERFVAGDIPNSLENASLNIATAASNFGKFPQFADANTVI